MIEPLFETSSAGVVTARPVNVGADLILYGTGLRGAAASDVKVTIGGVDAPVSSVGAEGTALGLDLVQVLVPVSLAGKGNVPGTLAVSGVEANTVNVTVK